MDSIDCLVIGAGVVGLAVARALALAGREVVVIEKNPAIGMETSSRNSEVIHAGLYYPTGSLKAKLCLEGREALYAYCEQRSVPHRQCGKLIVASSSAQLDAVDAIHRQALDNGCTEVRRLSRDEARRLEPALECAGGLISPRTGILDSHAYMLALQGDAEHAGAAFAFDSELLDAELRSEGILARIRGGQNMAEVFATTLVNCAGLWAPGIAARVTGLDPAALPQARYAKGNYFTLAGKSPFSHLVYPVPEPGGLGVHLTLDLGGQARFGPDVEWLDITTPEEADYAVDPSRALRFYEAIRHYWPALPDGALQPAYAGIRPKLANAGDFVFASHGCPAYLGLYGIESPGLTASLAIGRHAAQLLGH
ncbi:NAD(P)/FAD-dependent oxidoreductase [Oxalobacteraceae bacterium OM1]|nr:NAD(P)/FAD-dependent oxidoreductase [Oxalobacteraceae bacterium OM1]